MKTAEEIVNSLPSVKSGIDDFYGRQTVIKAIKEAQKEAYNQAVDDAVMNAEAKVKVWYDFDTGYYQRGDVIVDRNSILKLKK